MVFGADIFAVCEKLGLVVTCDKKSTVKELFEKQRVGVDALNTSHHAGRQGPLSWAERRTNLGQRIIGLWLHGATPVIIIDGPETAPGAGKYSQIEARARAHNPLTVVPTKDQDAFWDANQPWWSRDKLGDRFRRWRVEFAADCQEAEIVCIIGGRGEAEAALAWFESDQEIGGRTSLSCLHRGAVSDKDWFGYKGKLREDLAEVPGRAQTLQKRRLRLGGCLISTFISIYASKCPGAASGIETLASSTTPRVRHLIGSVHPNN